MKQFWGVVFVSTLFLPYGSAAAADLSVVVLQKGSGDPVREATVVAEDGSHAETDGRGKALLEGIDLPVTLKVLAMGHQTRLIQVNREETTVYLVPQAYDVEGLEVVEDRVAEKASKVVLSSEEVLQAPGSMGDPIKTIQSLPGVVSAAEGTGVMYMRGSDARDNSVRVNGLPLFYLYHFGGLQSTINPALVEDFNVFLGGFPVEYGDNLGGAIDVRLRAPKNDRLHQSYHIGTYESSLLVEGPVGDSGKDAFYFAARRSYIDFLMSPDQMNDLMGDDEEDEVSNEVITVPRFYDVQAAWRHTLEGGAVEFHYFSAGDKLALLNNESASTDPELAGELKYAIGYQTTGFNWHQQWNRQWSHEVVLSLSEYSQRFQIGSDPEGNPYYSNIEPWFLHTQPEIRWQPDAHERYTFGAELEYLNYPLELYVAEPPAPGQVDYDFTTAPKYRIHQTVRGSVAAPFVKYSRQWGERLTTIAGLRYSTIAGSGGISEQGFSPRLSIEYRLTPATTLLGAWGRYLQTPSAEYLLEGLGNPDLSYTEAEHRVLGVKWAMDRRWTAQAELYHKPMTRLVVGTDQDPPDNYVNRGTGEAYGADLLIKRAGGDGKMGWLSYSYAKSHRTNELTGERYDFQSDQPHTLTLVWSRPLRAGWRWGIRFQAASGRPYTPVVGRTQETLADGTTRYRPEYGEPYSERLPTYYRLDMRFDRTVLFDTSKLNFYFDIQNITGQQNVTGYDYGSEYQHYDNPREVRGMPFMPFFGIETTF